MENSILSKLNSTEDALELGLSASLEEVKRLEELRVMCGNEVKRLVKATSKDRDNIDLWNLALQMGTKAQLCREAIEVSVHNVN